MIKQGYSRFVRCERLWMWNTPSFTTTSIVNCHNDNNRILGQQQKQQYCRSFFCDSTIKSISSSSSMLSSSSSSSSPPSISPIRILQQQSINMSHQHPLRLQQQQQQRRLPFHSLSPLSSSCIQQRQQSLLSSQQQQQRQLSILINNFSNHSSSIGTNNHSSSTSAFTIEYYYHPYQQIRTFANHRHKRILQYTKGYRGRSKNCFTIAIRRLQKAWQYSYRDRKTKKRIYRTLWIQRIQGGVRQYSMRYSRFIHALSHYCTIQLNRKVLSELAATEPFAFKAIVDVVQYQQQLYDTTTTTNKQDQQEQQNKTISNQDTDTTTTTITITETTNESTTDELISSNKEEIAA